MVVLFYLIWCQLRKEKEVAFHFDFPVQKGRNSFKSAFILELNGKIW